MFREILPASCPPLDALTTFSYEVIRLVENESISADDFKSQAALQKSPPPEVDLCRWSSCSVWVRDIGQGVTKLPKLRGKRYRAILKIDGHNGFCKVKPNGHVDFWMFKNFDPVNAVTKVERSSQNE